MPTTPIKNIEQFPRQSPYQLARATSEADWHTYHAIRRLVLWELRNRQDYDCTRPEERAANNHPLLLKFDGQAIGTTRLDDCGDGSGIVRLVAITPAAQRKGHGQALALLVEQYAKALGLERLQVHAAADAVGFYQKMEWTMPSIEKTLSDGCVIMIKTLTIDNL